MSVSGEEVRAAFRGELARAQTADLLAETKRIQAARGWDFSRAWMFACKENPGLTTPLNLGQSTVSAREARIEKDPRLADALLKLKALEDDKTDAGIERHVKFLAAVKKLLSQDSSMTHDAAISRVIREHPELWAPPKHSAAVPRQYGTATAIGSSILVTAKLAVQFDGLPSVIQYMPGGRSTITPSVDGKPQEITVDVTPGTAAALQADLNRRLAGNIRPWIDFDHAGGKAAALPKRFYWEPDVGVMLELEWTNSGKSAISGQDYSYFSPTFMLNKHGEPVALPPSGAIGSLVNDPAFRTIRRIHQ
jgi:hypothetical protein